MHGEEGTGKTHLSLTVAAIARLDNQFATVYLDCKALQAFKPKIDSILFTLTETFRHAAFHAPSILILDNLDSLAPNFGSFPSSKEESAPQEMGVSPDLANQVKLLSDHTLPTRQHPIRHELP